MVAAENHSFRVILHYFMWMVSVIDIEKYIEKINFIVRFVQINATRIYFLSYIHI